VVKIRYMKHNILMLLGCSIPLLMIFIAPSLGLGSGITLFVFILIMFACHLMMPMQHGGHSQKLDNSQSTKIDDHEQHN
jgi:hypothetical protein